MEKRVLTYGNFDCFHYGHLRLLERAKSLGTFLMVGLSTDEFSLDKDKRPVFSYEQRKRDLEGISYVNEIIPEKSWDQKEWDIKEYSIDIVVMGDDWQGYFDDLPCEVIYLPRTKGISTTKIKERL